LNDVSTDYYTIQAAVDAAKDGDVIKIAGYCPGVNSRAGVTQTVYISKSITLRGGYTTTNWITPYPITQTTTLDAQGQGRVLYITGDISTTVEGLQITGGDATDLGGGPWDDAGGGMYVCSATVSITGCTVYNNIASTAHTGWGGGLYLVESNATLNDSIVISNTGSTSGWRGRGGGIGAFQNSGVALSDNTIQANIASTASSGFGGGLYVLFSPTILDGNIVQNNVASMTDWGWGGGIYFGSSEAKLNLNSNTIVNNTVSMISGGHGGGLHLGGGTVNLNSNTITRNSASTGGGLYALGPLTLTNNIVANNNATDKGSGLWLYTTPEDAFVGILHHNTIADNTGSDDGIAVKGYVTLTLTNNILIGHKVAITTSGGPTTPTVTTDHTLWDSNGIYTDTSSGGIIVTANDLVGSPAFVGGGDYHLMSSSVAIDTGADAGVTIDIDGDKRPQGMGYDIGADEYQSTSAFEHVYLPLLLRKH